MALLTTVLEPGRRRRWPTPSARSTTSASTDRTPTTASRPERRAVSDAGEPEIEIVIAEDAIERLAAYLSDSST